MKRYDMKVVGLQETKWFGNKVYDVSDAVALTCGRDTPSEDEGLQRGD